MFSVKNWIQNLTWELMSIITDHLKVLSKIKVFSLLLPVCLDTLPKMSTHLDLLSGPITADFSGADIVIQGKEPIEEHTKTNQCSWQQPSCVET